MTNIRVKIATAATILGLGGLGGFALASNPTPAAAPAPLTATQAQATSASAAGSAPATSTSVVTGASGAPAPTIPAATQRASISKPVVTHTSGGGTGSRRHASGGDEGRPVFDD